MFVTSVVCTRSPMANLFGVGGVTVTLAVPRCPSLVAVIVAEPAVTPVTSPFGSTVATAGLPLDQVTVRPVSGGPVASFGIAASWPVGPTGALVVAGLSVTAAPETGPGTVTPA